MAHPFFILIVVPVIALNLLIGRFRAATLVKSGRVTQRELNGFLWRTFALLGSAFVGFWVVLELSPQANIICLMAFPPRGPAGYALWSIQAGLSGTIVFWLWFRNGSDLLARLAPAFTRGAVIGRQYSGSRVKYLVSAFVLVAPLMNIAAQRAQPVLIAGCKNI
jgi:hypothetical protein